MSKGAKVSFGMIVLNGSPFIEENIRSLYSLAHEIIIVEGASPKAHHAANDDGHSLDNTLEIVRNYISTNDPLGKIRLVIAEDEGHPNGFWPGEKSQQSQAYAKRASGEWLWQIDVDEFYHIEDMQAILSFLEENPKTSCVIFSAYHFWGGFDFVVEGGFMWHPSYQGEGFGRYRRLFRWKPGWIYATHRPPSIFNEKGVDVTRSNMVDASKILKKSKVMYHYFMVSREIIARKAIYYSALSPEVFGNRIIECEVLMSKLSPLRALRIFDQFSTWNWLERFSGRHPASVERLLRNRPELRLEGLPFDFLNTLTSYHRYKAARALLRTWEQIASCIRSARYELVMIIIRQIRSNSDEIIKWLPRRLKQHRNPFSLLQAWEREQIEKHFFNNTKIDE